jgi:uncharacterized protein YggE
MFSKRTLYVGILVAAAMVLATGCTVASRAAETTLPTRTITVIGQGKAFGSPDVAYITVGIETLNESLQTAAEENRVKMAALLEAIKKLGIEDKDIRTSNYSVYTERQPVLEPRDGTKGEVGPLLYHVNNQVTVTVRDLTKLSEALDTAVTTGANNIYGVNFTVDDPSELQDAARADAVADAKARAESLAKLAGVSVGDVMSISEVIGGSVPVYYDSVKGMGSSSTPIEPGQLEVQTSVQVTYAIR